MLSVRGNRELQATVLALKLARRDVKNNINRATRATLNPIWRDAVAARASTPLDRQVIAKGARIKPGNPPVAVAASSKRAIEGGLVPVEQWHVVEFGADRDAVSTYTTHTHGGTRYKATRHTRRQLPARKRQGRVAYAAIGPVASRAASLWSSIVVKMFAEALEAGGR